MGAFLVTANEGKVIIKVRTEKVENLFSLNKKTLLIKSRSRGRYVFRRIS